VSEQQRTALLVGRTMEEADGLFAQVASLLYVVASCGVPDVEETLETFTVEVIVSTVPLDSPPRPCFVWQGEQANAEALRAFLEAMAQAEAELEPLEIAEEDEAQTQTAALFGAQAVVVPTVRVGFYGARGGVGVTMAAVNTAQALAKRGYRVLLADPTRRFDSWIYSGVQPPDDPNVEGEVRAETPDGRITLLAGIPDEAALQGFGALVVDGGRRSDWPIVVRWQRLEQRLEVEAIEEMVRRWAGEEVA